jgi:lysophospholipase L1-like esterase
MYSILCFGDSLTYGRGEIPSRGWVQRLKEDFETELIHKGVFNLGIPGETSQSLMSRIGNELKPRIWYRKDLDRYVVIVQVGLNDVRALVSKSNNVTPLEHFEKNMKEIISFAKDQVDEVFVLGILGVNESKTQPFEKNVFISNKHVERYNESLEIISKNLNVNFLNLYSNFNLKTPELFTDGIHLNKKGYDLFYQKLKENIKF